jgi:hypothetical protein
MRRTDGAVPDSPETLVGSKISLPYGWDAAVSSIDSERERDIG